jgi:hypothetical protein
MSTFTFVVSSSTFEALPARLVRTYLEIYVGNFNIAKFGIAGRPPHLPDSVAGVGVGPRPPPRTAEFRQATGSLNAETRR